MIYFLAVIGGAVVAMLCIIGAAAIIDALIYGW